MTLEMADDYPINHIGPKRRQHRWALFKKDMSPKGGNKHPAKILPGDFHPLNKRVQTFPKDSTPPLKGSTPFQKCPPPPQKGPPPFQKGPHPPKRVHAHPEGSTRPQKGPRPSRRVYTPPMCVSLSKHCICLSLSMHCMSQGELLPWDSQRVGTFLGFGL